jgi:hypothetical protein
VVWKAFKRVKANQGAAGVDKQSIAGFEADLSNNLYKLWNRMCPSFWLNRATSLICAFWHGDPNKNELLRGHAAAVARQSVPVVPIYVFDNGVEIPPMLLATADEVIE